MPTLLRMPDELYQAELGKVVCPHHACHILRDALRGYPGPQPAFHSHLLDFLARNYNAPDHLLEDAFQELQKDLARARVLITDDWPMISAYLWRPANGDQPGCWIIPGWVFAEHRAMLELALDNAKQDVPSAGVHEPPDTPASKAPNRSKKAAPVEPALRGRGQTGGDPVRQKKGDASQNAGLGGRGAYSNRDFDPAKAGGPLRDLRNDNIKITERGVAVVEMHTGRFGPDAANQYMVERLRLIAKGEMDSTKVDRNFYSHELREYVRYRRLGWKTGVPHDLGEAHELWNNTHTATLEEYRISGNPDNQLYHPEAIKLWGDF